MNLPRPQIQRDIKVRYYKKKNAISFVNIEVMVPFQSYIEI